MDMKNTVQRLLCAVCAVSLVALAACSTTTESPLISAEGAEEAESGNPAFGEETYDLLVSMYEPALQTLCWYYSDTSEDLLIDMEVAYEEDNIYRKVGRFATISEMKEATEQVFTKDFCEALFYGHAFDNSEHPMYKEIDGQLYRNISMGGFGWLYSLTDRYHLAYADDQWRVLGTNIKLLAGSEDEYDQWNYFVFQSEDDTWKFHHFFDYSPWRSYEVEAGPLLASPIAAFTWDSVSDLESEYMVSYYIYQFLADAGDDGYGDATPYSVPATEAVENLSGKFDGITKELLMEAAENEYSSLEYDEVADVFLFYITYDRGEYVVLNAEENNGNVAIQSLSIGKDGMATRWSNLTVQITDEGLRYFSNHVEEIPHD